MSLDLLFCEFSQRLGICIINCVNHLYYHKDWNAFDWCHISEKAGWPFQRVFRACFQNSVGGRDANQLVFLWFFC